jgi:PAS domain S-box-containing protein
MVGVHTIIEEYKCLESDLRESQEYYISMFEKNLAVMLLVDPATGEIVDANESACKYYGYNKDILTNIRIYHLNTSCQKYIDEAMGKVISNRNEFFQFEHKLANGERRYVEVYSSPIKAKERLLIFSIVHDVTERKAIELQLNSALKENQELLVKVLEYDRLKTEFFSNISHELKTPLNIILSVTQLMNAQLCQHKYCIHREKLHKYVSMSKQNSYRLLRLINNLIDITKLDTGFMKVNLSNHNIVALVEDIVLSVASYIESKDIDLVFDTDVEEKIMACDAEKMERVILNLMSNAIKFTESGGKICVDLYDKEETIIISVKDTGIGIAEDKKNIIFDRFRQVDATLTKKREGSGIGLSLVKSIIELHGGTIAVESILGKGSKFLIELPVKLIEEDFSNNETAAARETNIERIHLEFSDIYNNL